MKRQANAIQAQLALSILCLALVSCLFSNSKERSEGVIQFRISIDNQSFFHLIADSAFIVVSGQDMKSIKQMLTIQDSALVGTVKNVPTGRKKTFEISVLDSAGTLVYYGKDGFAQITSPPSILHI